MKTVGVLGGMGPAATIDFLARIVAATPAERDQDHLRLIIDNNPQLPDRHAAIAGHGESPAAAMAQMAAGLEGAGADFLVIACNTAHAFLDAVRDAVSIPVLDMVEETVAVARRRFPGARRAGLLAADGCRAARLYDNALDRQNLMPVQLDAAQQRKFMDLVYQLKAGADPAMLKLDMAGLAASLADADADLVIAACTEVPLLLSAADMTVPLVSSTDALVARTIEIARAQTSGFVPG